MLRCVAVLPSVCPGAWACAAVKLVAANTLRLDPGDKFVDEIRMWVYEEEVEGRKLTEIINESHENVKYMPGEKLGDNVVACASLQVRWPTHRLLFFCLVSVSSHSVEGASSG